MRWTKEKNHLDHLYYNVNGMREKLHLEKNEGGFIERLKMGDLIFVLDLKEKIERVMTATKIFIYIYFFF